MKESSNTIISCGMSEIGPIRDENQDTICALDDINRPGAKLYIVADGMGGYSNGKLASSLAVETFCKNFFNAKGSLSQRMQHAIQSANTQVYQTSQSMGSERMGTTLTSVYLDGHDLFIAHVGDSRVYLVRGRQVRCLTRDHTMVADLVRMKIISAEQLRTHYQRSILSRSVGLAPFVQPDVTRYTVREGDRLILCTDGLWSVLQDEEFAVLSSNSMDLERYINRMIELAIDRVTDDNVSAIGVQIVSLDHDNPPEKVDRWRWLRALKKSS